LLPILISIPHGGTQTPPEIRERVRLTREELFDDGDAYTRKIYDLSGEVLAVETAEVARAFVDLNRAPDDRPPTNPDGVVKSSTCYERRIYVPGREPDAELVDVLLERYYYPYHNRLREAGGDPRLRLALDCHSMAAVPPPIAPDRGRERPLFCLGNDDGRTCPSETIERLADALAATFGCGQTSISLNRPFAGGHIVRTYGASRVPWIQVEMNRSWYLEKPWFDRSSLTVDPERLAELRSRILAALSELSL
jgi:formiminoglutamase